MRRLLVVAALGAGCALGPGEPMGTLEPSLSARYALAEPGRDAGDGFQRLASDYQVRITRAELLPGPVALVERSSSGAGAFDPARPPAGYSNCHNGHCHSADGRLVSYEDIAAELGGGVQTRTVVALQGPGQVDLLAHAGPTPLTCEPDCVLPRAHIRRVTVPVQRLLIEGDVRDGRASKRFEGTRLFVLELEAPQGAPSPELTAEVDLPVDRESAPGIRLDVAVDVGPALFDRVDWAPLAEQGEPITLSTANDDALPELLTERAAVTVHVERTFP